MIWVILALSLITAAPILMFATASLMTEFGLIPVTVAGFVTIVAFASLPFIVALCTTFIVLAVLIVCRIAGRDDTTDTTDTTQGSA